MSNLVDNAVSFSPRGGTVTVAIATEEEHQRHRQRRGPGIRGDISRIFQRFYTDRPDGEHFGDHSGSASPFRARSSRRIGTISAANRADRSGALF